MENKLKYKELEDELIKLKKNNDALTEKNKKLEDELFSEKFLLEVLMENIPSRIYFKNTKCEFIKVNNYLAKRHGYSHSSDLIGKTDFDFFTKENAQVAFNDEIRIMKTREPLSEYEEKETWSNGEIAWVSTTKVPLIDKNDNVTGIFGITKDITERKESQREIKNQNDKLKELNATKDKFFSIIAHDLKAPFNTMLGFSKLLINNFSKYDEQTQIKFLKILSNDINNTFKLLENLLLWSNSQRGKIDFHPQSENIYLLATETIELLSQSANNKNISVINKIPESINIKVDKNMILTVLRNLISNALKFTPINGTIILELEQYKNENKFINQINIIDNGVGIDKENHDKLFNISKNFTTKGTEKESGTGLGLILCKEFVEKHGGKIWVDSEVGKGSTFSFSLPEIQ